MNLPLGITLVPFVHGRSAFSRHVRKLCLANAYDCIALDIPEPFQYDLPPAVSLLPLVSAVVAESEAEPAPLCYAPADPCDATVEAIRQAQQNRTALHCVGYPLLRAAAPLKLLPDEWALSRIGFDEYASLCLQALGNPAEGSPEDEEAQYIAWRLLQLRWSHSSILALVHMRHAARVAHHLGLERTHNLRFDKQPSVRLRTYYINPDHLYFALGELPFVAGKLEKERHDLFAPPIDLVDTIKDLFRETRDSYYENKEEALDLSPARIQAALVFLRNLTLLDGRFLPSLFDIVSAAKGVGGNRYGLRILKNAKYYPYLPIEDSGALLGVGIDKVHLPDDDSVRPAVNLFRDTALFWRTLSIKPDPSELRKRAYRFKWNPLGMCSHVPEDRRIENFNAHVRTKARRARAEDFVKTEPFLTSVKDGIDIRETLRNWYTGDIYVKELPAARGPLDTVIVIFDDQHDERYPHQVTWYAEHGQESTLTFYATNPFDDMIGPGIARSHYGGLSLLFPPRPIPNIFEMTAGLDFAKLSHRLAYGAMLFTKEKAVAYVAPRKPDIQLKMMAQSRAKHLVWIPLSSFSNETLRRLRVFHVLNGKTVRSWAGRFIGD